jgi:nucleotide-binding universal stress UspA family protein
MTEATAPRSILFATDLSSRCDRALDRALLIAREWQAPLVALTVLEPGTTAFPTGFARAAGRDDISLRRQAERRLRSDLAIDDLPLAARVEQGPVVDTILAVAAADGAALIVTGVARNEALSRIVLGSTVDALAHRSPVPLLVVRSRARAPYHRVVVATDFSAPSCHALETSAALFPDAGITLFHAFDNPYPTLAGMDLAQARSAGRESAEREAAAFLQTCTLPAAMLGRVHLSLEYGDPGLLLREHGAVHPADLVVLGTQRRRGLLALLMGSVAERILELAESDVLLVPPAQT